MRTAVAVALACLLLLTGCAPAEPSVARFKSAMELRGYADMDMDKMIEAGHKACETAKAAGEGVAGHGRKVAENMTTIDAAKWHTTVAEAAEQYLCPGQ